MRAFYTTRADETPRGPPDWVVREGCDHDRGQARPGLSGCRHRSSAPAPARNSWTVRAPRGREGRRRRPRRSRGLRRRSAGSAELRRARQGPRRRGSPRPCPPSRPARIRRCGARRRSSSQSSLPLPTGSEPSPGSPAGSPPRHGSSSRAARSPPALRIRGAWSAAALTRAAPPSC